MEKKTKIIFSVLVLSLILTILIYTLNSPQPIEKQDDKLVVAASIMPQKEFIERVGGNKVTTVIMVPSGADPHTYEPEPSKLRGISQAKVYIAVGSGIEFELTWMEKLKSINPSMTIINSSKGIKLIEESQNNSTDNSESTESSQSSNNSQISATETTSDPHVWTSPKNAMIMVENIYQGLIKVDPDNKEYYFQNKENYIKELKQLDNEITTELSKKNNSEILVYHPSWAYFCRDYGLKQIAIEKDGKEPSPQTITNIITQAKKDNITVVFVSPQFSTRNANTIAQEINAKVVIIDPLSPDYIKNMKNVLNALK